MPATRAWERRPADEWWRLPWACCGQSGGPSGEGRRGTEEHGWNDKGSAEGGTGRDQAEQDGAGHRSRFV